MESDSRSHQILRSEIEEQYKWRLEDIFATDEAWHRTCGSISPLIEQLNRYKGRLDESADSLRSALELSSQIDLELMELIAYARMRRDEDNTRSRYQSMADKAIGLYYQSISSTAFMAPEIAGIPPERIEMFLQQNEALEPFRHTLMDTLRSRQHILPEREEALLSRFGPVAEGLGDVFTMLDNVDLDFGRITDDRGQTIDLTHGSFARLRENTDRSVRSRAFEQVHQSFGRVGRTIAVLYATRIKADMLMAKARHYETSLDAALFSDNLTENIYSSLISTVRDFIPELDRYMILRSKSMAVDALHFYDTYVPMLNQPTRQYTFDQACDILRSALAPLGEQYLVDLEDHLTDRWIDVFETPGKTSGAYSWGSYRSHPYVLLNFNGTLSDLFTLAHEVGHSMHTFYSNKRPFPQSHYPIFLAEIASTVNENLLMNYLLDQCDERTEAGRQEKAYLINHFLEEFRLTVFRQTLFAEFEWRAHQAAEDGESLTADWLCDLYGRLLDDYYGRSVAVDDYMKWEWARIPHFYNAYYVFKYATGFSAAVALSGRLLAADPKAVEQYLDFLAAGNSDYPLEILARAGVDLRSGEPIQSALTRFSDHLSALSNMINRGL